MHSKISHVFFDKRLLLQDVTFRADDSTKSLIIVETGGVRHTYKFQDAASLEFYFHETGPIESQAVYALIVLRFASQQLLLSIPIPAADPVALFVRSPLKFGSFKRLVAGYGRLLGPDIVKSEGPARILPFLKAIVARCARDYKKSLLKESSDEEETEDGEKEEVKEEIKKEIKEEVKDEMVVEKNKNGLLVLRRKPPRMVDGCIALSSDDEDATSSTQPAYYLIDGKRIQVSKKGLASLAPRVYINDEIVNLALNRVLKEFPSVHLFDSLQTGKIVDIFSKGEFDDNVKMDKQLFTKHFYQYFYKSKEETRRPLADTFFGKRMLIFPICNANHWYLVVVVNPLYADVHDYVVEGDCKVKAVAYFIDSMKGNGNYSANMLHRVEFTWKCLLSFLRLGAEYFARSFIKTSLITCIYENNIPSQTNSFDCGAHLVQNAQIVGEMYETMIGAPDTVEISEEKRAAVMETVRGFREEFRAYLDSCRL